MIKHLVMMLGALALAAGCSSNSNNATPPPPPSPVTLGTYTQVALSVQDLEASLAFYQAMGFKVIGREPRPYPAATLSDGVIHVRLQESTFASPRLDYVYGSAVDRESHIRQLASLGIRTTMREGAVEFVSPEGLHVALVVRPLPEPPLNQSFSAAGRFGELALPTTDRERSIAFWKKLGYAPTAYDQPYLWAILRDASMVLGLHQSMDLTQPTLTYFAKDPAPFIALLQGKGYRVSNVKSEGGKPTSATLTSPDGQQFFLFTGP